MPSEERGPDLGMWTAAFRPGMPEYAATRFFFTREAAEQVRIGFANNGPLVDNSGTRSPVFTHAVTLTPELAVELARQLLKHYGSPFSGRPSASAPD